MRPEPTEAVQADSQVNEGVTAVSRPQVAPMDFLSRQRRVSWDQLKDNLAQVQWKEEGVPGAKQFDDYSAKLEKTRNERLKQQEDDTKQTLKAMNRGKVVKKKKKKDKKERTVKRTADGALLAGSSDDSSSDSNECLLSRYKKPS